MWFTTTLLLNGITAELNLKLQRLVNCTIRFIYDLKRDVYITPYRQYFKWLLVANRRAYFMAIMIYKILHGAVPQYLLDIFKMKNENIRSSSRISNYNVFHIPLHRTSLYANSFHLASIYLWHSLPNEITSLTSLPIFKIKLFQHLFENELALTR